MKDRIVEHPGRFRLTPVPGEDGVYDLVAVPGTVTEEGTALNKATLLSDETAALLGLSGDDRIVDKAYLASYAPVSYMAWAMNVSGNALDVSFGKGNEEMVLALGKQLALYSWLNGDTKIEHPYSSMYLKNKFSEIVEDSASVSEILASDILITLLKKSQYAYSILKDILINDDERYYSLLNDAGFLKLIKDEKEFYTKAITQDRYMQRLESSASAMQILKSSSLLASNSDIETYNATPYNAPCLLFTISSGGRGYGAGKTRTASLAYLNPTTLTTTLSDAYADYTFTVNRFCKYASMKFGGDGVSSKSKISTAVYIPCT